MLILDIVIDKVVVEILLVVILWLEIVEISLKELISEFGNVVIV